MSILLDLVDMNEKPESVHNINTKVFSISFPQSQSLQELAQESTNLDYSSAEYNVTAIILDNATYRLFRPVRSDLPMEKPKNFMQNKFLNKAVAAINHPSLLYQHHSLTKFQSTLEIKSHQLCDMNILALLPASCLTLHQPFQI